MCIRDRSKAARTKGATKSDPKDKQRSKVPPATQRNESAKDKFGAPPMNKWWTGSKESLMSAIYHAQRQVPPSNKAAYEKNWKNIVKQLQRKFPAPTAIYRKRLDEVQAMNMDTVPYNTVMKMKPGSTIKMKDGKIRTKDKFGNWRANTDRNDIIVNRDIVKHMKGMKGYNMGGGRVQIEGKAGRKI